MADDLAKLISNHDARRLLETTERIQAGEPNEETKSKEGKKKKKRGRKSLREIHLLT